MKFFKRMMGDVVTVEEIHETFLTEVDRILEEANKEISSEINKEIVAKGERLEKLGFIKISENKKGRIITSAGQKYVDKISAKIYKEVNPDKKPHITIKKNKKEETPKEQTE